MGSVYQKLVAATIAVGVISTIAIDGGWKLWLAIVPAVWVATCIRESIGRW